MYDSLAIGYNSIRTAGTIDVQQGRRGGKLQSRTDHETRHVMLSKSRGMITEVENVAGAGSGMYVIRHHTAARDAASIFDAGSWVGFRYRDANWSFLKQAD